MKLLLLILISQAFSATESTLGPQFPEAIKKLSNQHGIKSSHLSWSLKRIDQQSEFSGVNQDKKVIPASLTKILTVWNALETLGPNYQFETELLSVSKINNGVLEGDLILKGAGDPFFTNAMLMNLAMKLKNRGITSIKGKFYYDQSALPKSDMISSIGLGDQTYNPGVSALSLEFNRFTVWKGNKPIPPLSSLKIMNVREKFTPGKRFKAMNGDPNVEAWTLSKSQRYGVLEEVPVRNPALIFADTFRMIAKKIGVELPSPQEGQAKGRTLVTEKSQPLHLITKSVMEYSNNMMAELLLLNSTKKDSIKSSAGELQKKLKAEFSGLDLDLLNGSGLDSENKLTPKSLTLFLEKNFHKTFEDISFTSLFSISGQSGWMLRRLNDPTLAYNVWAKTGSLDYIDNMAGYLFTKSGKIYAFSFFINDLEKRNLLDGPNSEKNNRLREKAKKWRKSSKPLTDAILRHWYRTL